MSEIEITTNHQWREFLYRHDVPAGVLADQFDWTDDAHAEHGDYSDGFIHYRGCWYHVGQFERIPASDGPFKGWHGAHGDSFFSGVLIRLSDDGETYQIATYTS